VSKHPGRESPAKAARAHAEARTQAKAAQAQADLAEAKVTVAKEQDAAIARRLREPDRQNVAVAGASSAGDADVGEQGHHLQAQRLVVPVDVGPVAGGAADPRVGDAGQERRDDVFAEGEQGADDPGRAG